MPEDADMESITMIFEGEVLRVFIPRVTREKVAAAEIKYEAVVKDSMEEKKKPKMPQQSRTLICLRKRTCIKQLEMKKDQEESTTMQEESNPD